MIFGLYEKRGEVDIWPSFLSFKVLFVKPPSLCPHVRHRARINLLNRLCEERIGRVNSSHGRIETRAFRVIRAAPTPRPPCARGRTAGTSSGRPLRGCPSYTAARRGPRGIPALPSAPEKWHAHNFVKGVMDSKKSGIISMVKANLPIRYHFPADTTIYRLESIYRFWHFCVCFAFFE